MRIFKPFFWSLLAVAISAPGFSQSWDNSGNGLLNGTYYFRQVVWIQSGDQYGDMYDGIALYNTITFDGSGHYSVNGLYFDGGLGMTSPQPYSVTGTYTIAASGYGFLDNPATQLIAQSEGVSISSPDQVYGLVSHGIFIGSSTENANFYNDLLIAAPVTNATVSSFSGTYALTGMDSPDFYSSDVRDYLILGSANGSGQFSATQKAAGFIGAYGGLTQQIGSVSYQFNNGAGNIHFGNSLQNVYNDTVLFAGDHYIYPSPDGNFVFGGSPTGWDMLVGVKTSGTPSSSIYSGLYYQAGMDEDESQQAYYGYGGQDSYYSSFKAQSVAHQRINSSEATDTSGNVIPYDFTFTDDVAFGSGGVSDGYQNYYFSQNGVYRAGVGLSPSLGVSVAIAGPTFNGTGLALDPTGLVNTGSNAPFTAQIVPGELVTIYGQSGSTLANGKGQANNLTLSSTVDNTQVMVNGVAAPMLAVNECGPYPCVTFVVPYETPSPGIADIQLFNQGKPSNTISAFVGYTSPGVFLLPQLGLGSANMYYAAAIHSNGQIVSPSNPAQVGETIAIFLTGIGSVTPSVTDGAPGPANPTAGPVNTLDVNLSSTAANGATGLAATTAYVGLAPLEVAGLAQINLTIPAGTTAGDNVVEIVGPDSDTVMALISVGSGTASAIETAKVPSARAMHHAARPRFASKRQLRPKKVTGLGAEAPNRGAAGPQ